MLWEEFGEPLHFLKPGEREPEEKSAPSPILKKRRKSSLERWAGK
jgi:hypothetical protein